MSDYLTPLLLGILSSALVTWIAFLIKKINEYPMAFSERIKAENSMKSDISRSIQIKFYGVSHIKLEKYLSEIFDTAKQSNEQLPMEEIYIYFAKTEVGNIWEKENFVENIIKVVRRISKFLTSPNTKPTAPNLRTISFKQVEHISFFGGCKLIDSKGGEVIYVVHYTPGPTRESDTTLSYTYRLTLQKSKKFNLYKRYSTAYEYIDKNSHFIFNVEIKKDNAWNASPEVWDKFEIKHRIYEKTMSDLVEFSQIPDKGKVLDIGAGTGRMSKIIKKTVKLKKLVLLDNSSQMLGYVTNLDNKKDSNESIIDFILTDARNSRPLYGAYENMKFDRILCHFSMQLILTDNLNEETLSHIWKKHLKKRGRLIFSLHNTLFSGYEPKGYEKWEDPLRKKLVEYAQKNGYQQLDFRKYEIDDLISHFKMAGLNFIEKKFIEYKRTMSDRLDMWKVPGIFTNSFKISENQWQLFINYICSIEKDLINLPTKPMTVIYLSFENSG